MGRARRTSEQIRRDRDEVMRLSVEGKTLDEIAAEVGLSVAQADRELKQINEAWKRDARQSFVTAKARALAKTAVLEREYWKAFRESQKAGDSDGVGEPRFLAGVMKCIERECRMMGTDPPTVDPTRALTLDEMQSLLREVFDTIERHVHDDGALSRIAAEMEAAGQQKVPHRTSDRERARMICELLAGAHDRAQLERDVCLVSDGVRDG